MSPTRADPLAESRKSGSERIKYKIADIVYLIKIYHRLFFHTFSHLFPLISTFWQFSVGHQQHKNNNE